MNKSIDVSKFNNFFCSNVFFSVLTIIVIHGVFSNISNILWYVTLLRILLTRYREKGIRSQDFLWKNSKIFLESVIELNLLKSEELVSATPTYTCSLSQLITTWKKINIQRSIYYYFVIFKQHICLRIYADVFFCKNHLINKLQQISIALQNVIDWIEFQLKVNGS